MRCAFSAVLGDPMSRAELQRYVTLGVDVFLRGIEPEKPQTQAQMSRRLGREDAGSTLAHGPGDQYAAGRWMTRSCSVCWTARAS